MRKPLKFSHSMIAVAAVGVVLLVLGAWGETKARALRRDTAPALRQIQSLGKDLQEAELWRAKISAIAEYAAKQDSGVGPDADLPPDIPIPVSSVPVWRPLRSVPEGTRLSARSESLQWDRISPQDFAAALDALSAAGRRVTELEMNVIQGGDIHARIDVLSFVAE